MNEVFADKLPLKLRKLTFGVNFGVLKFSIEAARESKEYKKERICLSRCYSARSIQSSANWLK